MRRQRLAQHDGAVWALMDTSLRRTRPDDIFHQDTPLEAPKGIVSDGQEVMVLDGLTLLRWRAEGAEPQAQIIPTASAGPVIMGRGAGRLWIFDGEVVEVYALTPKRADLMGVLDLQGACPLDIAFLDTPVYPWLDQLYAVDESGPRASPVGMDASDMTRLAQGGGARLWLGHSGGRLHGIDPKTGAIEALIDLGDEIPLALSAREAKVAALSAPPYAPEAWRITLNGRALARGGGRQMPFDDLYLGADFVAAAGPNRVEIWPLL